MNNPHNKTENNTKIDETILSTSNSDLVDSDADSAKINPTLKEVVLGRIRKDCVTPRAKWACMFSENFMWILWILTIAFGAVGFSEILYTGFHSGIEFYNLTHSSFTQFVIDSLPLLWIVFFLLMVALAYYNFRQTKRGYRYPFWKIIGSSLLVSFLMGFGLNEVGANKKIEGMIEQMPMPMPYETVIDRQAYLWAHPEDGRITGVYVSEYEKDMYFKFKDAVDREWIVMSHELIPQDLELLTSGKQVRLLGEAVNKTDSLVFYACVVLPWMSEGGDSWQTIKENRELLNYHMTHFGSNPELQTENFLKCREILKKVVN